jgi:1,2-diacylglycerol 3-alpha-glucosyltransferase
VKGRVVLVTEIISPYRIPLFNALARQPGIDLHVIFLSETDPSLRQWQIYKHEISFSYGVLFSWRRRIGRYNLLIDPRMTRALKAAAPEIVVCGGYSYLASWQSLLWSRWHQVPFLLWSESNEQDLRRRTLIVEFLKKEFLSRCTAFLVPGQSARAYLRALGVHNENIFTAPNAVDNDLFAVAAERARSHAQELRKELTLPERYFLFVGRLVFEKGVFDLLDAYAKLESRLRDQVGLVFAGDGPCRQALEEQAAKISPGDIRFTGFIQRDELPGYYSLSEALILPTHSDTWGLVVNEAMACGLPVVVSTVAGCACDLVKPDWNGFLIPSRNSSSLSLAMASLAGQSQLNKTMGSNSREHISQYTPEIWGKSIAAATNAMESARE